MSQLVRLGDKWILLMSPQQPCEYFIGELDLATPRFIPEAHGILDAGMAYASNISFDDLGRTILWYGAEPTRRRSEGGTVA